jgi:hypothetical protein
MILFVMVRLGWLARAQVPHCDSRMARSAPSITPLPSRSGSLGGQAGGGAQVAYAPWTQMASQLELQQKASSAHTALQHVSESQVGVACGVKHDPAAASPQAGASGEHEIVIFPALVVTPPGARLVSGPNATM